MATRELDLINEKITPDVEVVNQQSPTELKYIKSQPLKRGMFLFEYNILTGEIEKAKFDSAIDSASGMVRHKVIVNADCLYCQAINKQNAKRKAEKRLNDLHGR